ERPYRPPASGRPALGTNSNDHTHRDHCSLPCTHRVLCSGGAATPRGPRPVQPAWGWLKDFLDSSSNSARTHTDPRLRRRKYAHWQNRSVPHASIIWLARAVNVVRPVALRLHFDRVRIAKGGRLRFTLAVCMSWFGNFSMIGRPSTGMFAASSSAANCEKPQLCC